MADRWERQWQGRADAAVRRQEFDRIWSAYTASDRHYHDIRHIAGCLAALDSVREQAHDPATLEAAIWFHDVVYDGRRDDNEQESARWAEASLQRLQTPPEFRARVEQLILLTRHDRTPESIDAKMMVDIDLSSLALPPGAFDDNSRRIRLEHAHVPENDFNRGRQQLLGHFLSRPRIYHTAEFFSRCEPQARENLRRVLSALPQ